MTLSTLALVVALAAVVVLTWWMLSLHRQVRRLAAAVESAARSTAPAGGPDAAGTAGRQERAAEGTSATVPVITAVRLRPVGRDGGESNSRVASVTLGEPLIKLAALSHGVRRALDEEHRLRLRLVMRRELRRQRKLRRRRAGGTTGAEGWSA